MVIDGAAVPSHFGRAQYHTVQLLYRGRRQGHEVSDRICALAPYDTAPCQFPWPCFRGMTAPCPLCGSSSEWIIHDGPASGGKTIRRVHLEFDGGSRYEKTDQRGSSMKPWSLKLLLSRTMSVALQITYCIQYCCVEFPTLRNAR